MTPWLPASLYNFRGAKFAAFTLATLLAAFPSASALAQAETVAAGTALTLAVTADGYPSPTFQWHKDGAAITGATSNLLTVASVSLKDRGSYSVLATNELGSATSPVLVLTVDTLISQLPVFTTQPTAQTGAAGSTATFSVTASGSPVPTYQWQKNGTALAGQTSAVLTLTSLTVNDNALYSAVATNGSGSITSIGANLTVSAPLGGGIPAFTLHPWSQEVKAGTDVVFNVIVTGSPAPTIQWYANGVAIPGETSATLIVKNARLDQANSGYTATATNSAGSVTSNVAALWVAAGTPPSPVTNVAPEFQTQPATQSGDAGSSITFTVTATGTPAAAFQWKKDGSNISGATSSTFTVTGLTTLDAGIYTAVASNVMGNVTSSGATLTVVPVGPVLPPINLSAPHIYIQPKSQTVGEGSSVTFSVSANTYQWFKDGVALPGATHANYSVGTVLHEDAGNYTVLVTDLRGSVTSSAARLTVSTPAPVTLLGGDVISSAPYNNDIRFAGYQAFDGSGSSFFASRMSDPIPYVGRDLGAAKTITRIRYVPVTGFTERMVGGKFRGANLADLSDAVTLHTITQNPAAGVYQDVALEASSATYRYIFYTTAYENNGNVSELEFYGLAAL